MGLQSNLTHANNIFVTTAIATAVDRHSTTSAAVMEKFNNRTTIWLLDPNLLYIDYNTVFILIL